MIKPINALLLTLLFASSSAWADWVRVYTNENQTSFLIDPATIRKEGDFRKVWEIQDRKNPNKKGAISFRGKREYDCKNERSRILSLSTHSKPLAGGLLISDLGEDPSGWLELPPNTAGAAILKIVCAE